MGGAASRWAWAMSWEVLATDSTCILRPAGGAVDVSAARYSRGRRCFESGRAGQNITLDNGPAATTLVCCPSFIASSLRSLFSNMVCLFTLSVVLSFSPRPGFGSSSAAVARPGRGRRVWVGLGWHLRLLGIRQQRRGGMDGTFSYDGATAMFRRPFASSPSSQAQLL